MPSSAENSPSNGATDESPNEFPNGTPDEPSDEPVPHLKIPPHILSLRQKIFALDSPLTIPVAEFNNAWKYLDNIYVRNQSRYGQSKTTTYYWCRLWRTKAYESTITDEQRKRKRKVREPIGCPCRVRIVSDGYHMSVTRGKERHNHDISALEYKLTTAARDLAAKAVSKGNRPSLVARELKNSGIGHFITSKDAWNAGNLWITRKERRPPWQIHTPRNALMQAIVANEPGPPEVLHIEEYPKPPPKFGEVLIEVKAFGLSRAEVVARQGHSADVKFPRVMGREAVGIVVEGSFAPGTKVIATTRDLPPEYSGSYAQYTRIPVTHVRRIHPSCQLSWEHLAAFPEMIQTAWNALFRALRLHPTDRLLIRGGTTSIGLAAACIAKRHCSFIGSTTRQGCRQEILKEMGANQVLIDDGSLSEKIKSEELEFTKVLDLIGAKTIADSLQCVRPYGVVCMAGTVSEESNISNFNPMDAVPSTVCFTTYKSSTDDFQNFPLDGICYDVETGQLKLPHIRIYLAGQIAGAHQCLEENRAEGKVVVLW
ncbi:hypothetical protein BDV23DRAFT_187989 [Aspergillus alliaceus]|uniref:Enoyl reductase (ER) domain-containing protein n=1 Tax=Petromyces alliaceus TaxID=209559 RepID=A0A5N7BVB6_PETAA|nr:hypothetical protein BDV23DRAFT_187989 [Aspergillus alliaceus]